MEYNKRIEEQLSVDVFKLTDRLMHIGHSLEILADSYTMDIEVKYLITKIEELNDEFRKKERRLIVLLKGMEIYSDERTIEKLMEYWIEFSVFLVQIKIALLKYEKYVDRIVNGPFEEIYELIPEINSLFKSIIEKQELSLSMNLIKESKKYTGLEKGEVFTLDGPQLQSRGKTNGMMR